MVDLFPLATIDPRAGKPGYYHRLLPDCPFVELSDEQPVRHLLNSLLLVWVLRSLEKEAVG